MTGAISFDTNELHVWIRGERPQARVWFDEDTGIQHVYGHREAMEVMGDPVTFSSDFQRLFPTKFKFGKDLTDGNMVRMDPPEHSKLRKIVSHAFTPRVIADLEPRIAALTNELLDEVAEHDRMELVDRFAYPLPVIVIAELLGVPASDRAWFKQLMRTELESARDALVDFESELERRIADIRQIRAYFAEHAAERRRAPRADLLTRLVEAEVDGERLSDDQVVNFANLLLIAGHITTTSMLGNTVLVLDDNPAQAARVRADRTLVPGAIEESLRLYPPFQRILRTTMRDTEIGGHRIPRDRLVSVWLGAANRDESVFSDPHVFEPARDPNPHLAWGRGVHFCLGTPLSRLEGRIALNILFDRYPKLRTDPQRRPTFLPSPDFTSVRELPVLLR
ncbi:cytochrome P450 [Amycolatopsis ultiminotia]|uniref:Cytochrome P450 n=1 Tax=Amycolatopsis ultiminotia TaxID=543629 RepID=A0ABP6VKY1_9PSEU